MVRKFLAIDCTAETETQDAFCASDVEFDIDGITHEVNELWIPKSVIYSDDQEIIDDLERGERATIHVAKWWLRKAV